MYETVTVVVIGKCYRKRFRRFKGPRTNARRWGEARERDVLRNGPLKREKEVPTLAAFKDRFLNDYARANRQKASGRSRGGAGELKEIERVTW